MKTKLEDAALFHRVIPAPLRKGEQRKLAIVSGAIRCLATHGMDRFTFDAVGKSCRISKSHVAYHFPSLDALAQTCVRYVYTVGQSYVAEALRREARPGKRVEAYIRGTFRWIEAHPEHAAVAMLLAYCSTVRADYRAIQTEVKAIGAARIAAILEGVPGKSRLPRRLLADTLQSLVMAKLLYLVSTEGGDFRTAEAETIAAAKALLN